MIQRVITKRQLMEAMRRAVVKSYLAELIRTTPGRGIVADAWDVEMGDNEISLVNKEWGHVVKFLEDGTKAHKIVAKDAQALRWKVGPGDTYAFAKSVMHPGITARKFVHKVLEDPNVEKKFQKEFEIEIRKLGM